MKTRNKWILLLLIGVAAVVLIVLFTVPTGGTLRIQLNPTDALSPSQLTELLPYLRLRLQNTQGTAYPQPSWEDKSLKWLELPAGDYSVRLDATFSTITIYEGRVTIPRGNLVFRSKPVEKIIPVSVPVLLEIQKKSMDGTSLHFSVSHKGWAKDVPLFYAIGKNPEQKLNGLDIRIPVDTLTDTASVTLSVFWKPQPGISQLATRTTIEINRFTLLSAVPTQNGNALTVDWIWKKGIIEPTLFRLLISEKVFSEIAPQGPIQIPITDFLKVSGTPKFVINPIPIKIEAVIEDKTWSQIMATPTVYRYPIEIAFPKVLQNNLRPDVMKLMYDGVSLPYSLLDGTISSWLYTFIEQKDSFPITIRIGENWEQTFHLPTNPPTSIILDKLNTIRSAALLVTEEGSLSVNLQMEFTESDGVFINPSEYRVRILPKLEEIVFEKPTFLLTSTPSSMEIEITPVYFHTIEGSMLTVKKAEFPRLILEIPPVIPEGMLTIGYNVVTTASFVLDYRLKQYREIDSETKKDWSKLPSSWITVTRTASSGELLPDFGTFEVDLSGIKGIGDKDVSLEVEGEVRVTDPFGQKDVYPFQVLKEATPKIRFSKFSLKDDELIVRWEFEAGMQPIEFEKFMLFLDTERGEISTLETTDSEMKLNLKTLLGRKLSLTLGIMLKGGRYVPLDDTVLDLFGNSYSNLVDMNIEKDASGRWKLIYRVKKAEGFKGITFVVTENRNPIVEAKFTELAGSFNWPTSPGNTYEITASIEYETIEVTQSRQDTAPPRSGGILDVFQVSATQIRLIAIDSAPDMRYEWVVSNSRQKLTVTTATSLVDLQIKEVTDEPLEVQLTALHAKTGSVYQDRRRVYLMKADIYLYEDIIDKKELRFPTKVVYMSRNITVFPQGSLSIFVSELCVAPDKWLYLKNGTKLQIESTRVSVRKNDTSLRWVGIYSEGATIQLTGNRSEFRDANTLFTLRGNSMLTLQGGQILNIAQSAIDSVGSTLTIDNARFDGISRAIVSNSSDVNITGTTFTNVIDAVSISGGATVTLAGNQYDSISGSSISVSGSQNFAVMNEQVNQQERYRLQTAMDITNSKGVIKGVQITGAEIGMRIASSDIQIDETKVVNVSYGIVTSRSFFVLRGVEVVAQETALSASTDSPVRTVQLESQGQTTFAALIYDNKLSGKTAIEIVAGKHSIYVNQGTVLQGIVISGGQTQGIFGEVFPRGDVMID